MLAHSRDPHPAIKLWCQVPFTKSKKKNQLKCIACHLLFEKQMYNSGNFNGKNWWIIKKVTVLKKLLPHLATRGTYSPGDWRCDEAWREQTLVYPPVMCQQRLIYCTWELNIMHGPHVVLNIGVSDDPWYYDIRNNLCWPKDLYEPMKPHARYNIIQVYCLDKLIIYGWPAIGKYFLASKISKHLPLHNNQRIHISIWKRHIIYNLPMPAH